MRRDPISGTYARALMEVGQAKGKVDEFFEELEALQAHVFSQREFRVFFQSPKIPRPDKKAALDKALQGKVSEEVMNLLRILIDRGRQLIFDEIQESFSDLYDAFKRRMHVRVTSAAGIGDAAKNQLVELLSQKLDREIIMTEGVDEDLLGGMTIRFGDTVIDGSVRTQLNRVREAVASPRLGSDLIHEN